MLKKTKPVRRPLVPAKKPLRFVGLQFDKLFLIDSTNREHPIEGELAWPLGGDTHGKRIMSVRLAELVASHLGIPAAVHGAEVITGAFAVSPNGSTAPALPARLGAGTVPAKAQPRSRADELVRTFLRAFDDNRVADRTRRGRKPRVAADAIGVLDQKAAWPRARLFLFATALVEMFPVPADRTLLVERLKAMEIIMIHTAGGADLVRVVVSDTNRKAYRLNRKKLKQALAKLG